MSRKKTQPKKNIVPDPKFKSTILVWQRHINK